MKIRTEHVYPPIPIRNFDWCAVDDDTYDGPGSPIGSGATEAEAITDLREQLGLTVQPQRLTCIASVPGRKDQWDECDRDAEHECISCGEGVCIRCLLGCFSCGEPLHDHCREDHAEDTGHVVDFPPGGIAALLDRDVDPISVFLDGRL